MAEVVNPPAARRSFGRTQRHDTWWIEIIPVDVLLGGFGALKVRGYIIRDGSWRWI